MSGFLDPRREPDLVRVFGPDGAVAVHRTPDGLWIGDGVVVGFAAEPDHLAVRLVATAPVCRVQLRWRGGGAAGARYLGDHWERAYGDLEWRTEAPERVLPWYVLAHVPPPAGGLTGGGVTGGGVTGGGVTGGGVTGGGVTHGYGVRVGPAALCFWTADSAGLSLWADVRSGGRPVRPGGRPLAVADVVAREGVPGESPDEAHRALCRLMCPRPRMPDHPVYGTNDWHVRYGRATLDDILRAADQVSRLSPDTGNRPYCVIDDGWSAGGLGLGPWVGNARYGDMGDAAERLGDLGVRPGIWYRPLTSLPGVPARYHLPRGTLDPSRPEVLALVADHVRRLTGWGYRIIKHDFTTFDVLGRWGREMGAGVTDDGWGFAADDRTTAEILSGLYRAIRDAAGEALLIGCNTIGHLAAGLVELQRIGDDTSGVSWHRTRRMGVNALAFRAAQHGTFFAADADVAPVTPALPPHLARRWLDLVAASGTPLFVSVSPEIDDPGILGAVAAALGRAARPAPTAQPLDWLDTRCPRRWLLDGEERRFDWLGDDGGWPFPD